MPKAKWIAHMKGSHDGPFEVAIIRSDNSYGLRRYGCFNKDKMLVSHSGGFYRAVDPIVWKELVDVSRRLARELNEEEGL